MCSYEGGIGMLKKEIFGKVKKALALTLTSVMIATLCSNFVGGTES